MSFDAETTMYQSSMVKVHNIPKFVEQKPNKDIEINQGEAKEIVKQWLFMHVSMMLQADPPEKVIEEVDIETEIIYTNGASPNASKSTVTKSLWRVPVFYTASHVGRVGVVGDVYVDAVSGWLYDAINQKESLVREGKILAQSLPPYQHGAKINAIPQPIPITPRPKPGSPKGDLAEILAALGH
ncbi:MAG: hypothetical protein AAF639_07390 [Chloroflexota bacterium]